MPRARTAQPFDAWLADLRGIAGEPERPPDPTSEATIEVTVAPPPAEPAELDLVDLAALRERARRGLAIPTDRLSDVERRLVVGPLDWAIVTAGQSASGRRLLIVELDDDAEARVLAALEVLAGRPA